MLRWVTPLIVLMLPAAAIAQPVSCSARLWHNETLTLILKKLDSGRGTAEIDIEMLNRRNGGAEINARWSYKDGSLNYLNPNRVQYRLTVGTDELKGSFINWNAPRLSDDNLTFKCDGPTERVIVQ